MFNNWEMAFFFFSHLWVNFSQILSDSSSASVSSQNPRASLSRPQAAPPGWSEMLTLGVHAYGVGGNFTQATDSIHSVRTASYVCFSFFFKVFVRDLVTWVTRFCCPRSAHVVVSSYPRNHSWRNALNFLFFFLTLWILSSLCKHPKVTLIDYS